MKHKGIVMFLIILAIVIVALVALDFNGSKPDMQPANPYEFNVDQFSKIDTALIHYKESRNLAISFSEPSGVCFLEGRLYVVGDQKIQIIQPTGKLIKEVVFDQKAGCVYASAANIFVGFKNSLGIFMTNGSPRLIKSFP